MKERLTPREKKLLSYVRDGRNVRSQSRAHAHKAISRRKARANRAFRRAESMAPDAAAGADPGAEPDVFVARTGRGSWTKIPDAPLGEYVAWLLEAGEWRGMTGDAEPGEPPRAGRRRSRRRKFWPMGFPPIEAGPA